MAMETRVAPTFASFVVAYLEIQIYKHTRPFNLARRICVIASKLKT